MLKDLCVGALGPKDLGLNSDSILGVRLSFLICTMGLILIPAFWGIRRRNLCNLWEEYLGWSQPWVPAPVRRQCLLACVVVSAALWWFIFFAQFRLVVKTALKLLLVFVEYSESNAPLLIQAVSAVDTKRGEWSPPPYFIKVKMSDAGRHPLCICSKQRMNRIPLVWTSHCRKYIFYDSKYTKIRDGTRFDKERKALIGIPRTDLNLVVMLCPQPPSLNTYRTLLLFSHLLWVILSPSSLPFTRALSALTLRWDPNQGKSMCFFLPEHVVIWCQIWNLLWPRVDHRANWESLMKTANGSETSVGISKASEWGLGPKVGVREDSEANPFIDSWRSYVPSPSSGGYFRMMNGFFIFMS